MQTTHTQDAAYALSILDAMPAVDLFDYLADYAVEPAEDARDLRSLRSAVLCDLSKVGPAVFIERTAE